MWDACVLEVIDRVSGWGPISLESHPCSMVSLEQMSKLPERQTCTPELPCQHAKQAEGPRNYPADARVAAVRVNWAVAVVAGGVGLAHNLRGKHQRARLVGSQVHKNKAQPSK